MSLPTGTALTATIRYTKAGALYDPSPLPTVIDARYPDASVLSPLPALVHPAVGIFTATVFAAVQSTQTGTYDAAVWTTDTTVDCQGVWVEWPEVGVNIVTAYTVSAATLAAVLAGSDITVQRGDSLSVSLTGLGVLTGYSHLWFTAKRSPDDADSAAIVQVLLTSPAEGTDGLIVLNGAATTAAWGSITVTNAVLGNITIAVDEEATTLLTPVAGLYYDVQMLNAGTVTTLTAGSLDVAADITRSVS